MANYEYKAVVLPITGALKQKWPDMDGTLNKEASEGWRLSQMALHSTMGTSDSIVMIFEKKNE
jgi:Domain of unknown function (DUF4177)